MADPIVVKVSALPEIPALASDDLFEVVDSSETVVANKTKKMAASKVKVFNADQITDGIVTSSKLANGSVVEAKIGAGAVTDVKLDAALSKKISGALIQVQNMSFTQENTVSKAVTFTTKNIDTHNFFVSSTPDKVIIPAGMAGWYMVTMWVDFNDYAGTKQLSLLKNGSNIDGSRIQIYPSNGVALSHSILVHLVVGDAITFVIYQGSGSALNGVKAMLTLDLRKLD